MHELQLKNIPFEIKELSDTGDFVGFASVYGNIDQGNDVVEPGAFDETIKERGGKVRLMDNHKVRIGMAAVESTALGLKAVGKINTKKQSGLEALSDLKFYQEHGQPMGMSIGYETIDAIPAHKSKDGARHLTKVRLWEVTVTEFPMNELAEVTSVKSMRHLIASIKASQEKKDDFDLALQKIQLMSARYQMFNALSWALDDALYSDDGGDPIAESETTISQFSAAYMGMLPDFLGLKAGMEWMSLPADFENKAGRVLSSANRELISKCITDLQALLDAADPDKAAAKVVAEKSDAPTGAEETSTEQTTDHSDEVMELMGGIRSLIPV